MCQLLDTMNRFENIRDWVLSKDYPLANRMAEVSIKVVEPDFETLKKLLPIEREEFIANFKEKKTQDLLKSLAISKYEYLRQHEEIQGLRCRLPYSRLVELKKYRQIAEKGIFIHKIEGAKKFVSRSAYSFLGLKVIIAMWVEGEMSKPPVYEEMTVLIKAKSFEDACKRVEKNATDYERSYLNEDYEIVEWKLEKIDDYYISDVHDVKDFAKEGGNQVFSVISKSLTHES